MTLTACAVGFRVFLMYGLGLVLGLVLHVSSSQSKGCNFKKLMKLGYKEQENRPIWIQGLVTSELQYQLGAVVERISSHKHPLRGSRSP